MSRAIHAVAERRGNSGPGPLAWREPVSGKTGKEGRTWEHRIFLSAPPELPLVTKKMQTKTLWDPICTVVSSLGSGVSLGDGVGK